MTKLGTGDDIPANALRNKKERDRYAVVTSTLKILKTKLKMAHGNQTKVLEASLAELRRLKMEQVDKIGQRDRLYQSLQLPIPSFPTVERKPDVHLSPLPMGCPSPAPQNIQNDRAGNFLLMGQGFDGDMKRPVPAYRPPQPPYQMYSPVAPFYRVVPCPTYPQDQWIQSPWMEQQFPPQPCAQDFSLHNPADSIESLPPNPHIYNPPTPPAPEDTQILHEFLLEQYTG